MLTSLHVENVALLKSVDVDFSNGFSAFTGETGAGKSMMIDSINFLLGNRADKEMIRRGESTALVSGVFDALPAQTVNSLAELGIEIGEDGTLLLQRTMSSDGKTAVRINGRPSTLSVLREISPLLLHIHGQNDNRLLTDPSNHIRILDNFANVGAMLETYKDTYRQYSEIKKEIASIKAEESERRRITEMLRFQVEEIDALSLHPGEMEKLEEKRNFLKNAEKISKHTAFSYFALKGSEKGSAVYILTKAVQSIRKLEDTLPSAEKLANDLEEILWKIDDIAEQVSDLGSGADEDPTTLLDRVESRLSAIGRLEKKYGNTVEEILAFRDESAKRLSLLDNADVRLEELEKEKAALAKKAEEQATLLRKKREDAALRLEKGIVDNLLFLDMPKVVFKIDVSQKAPLNGETLFADGFDRVEFLISTNPGEAPAPMAKIASGGELSRIMLALKSVIADRDGVSTVIYDEIDTGVSGKTARKIGMKLRDSANTIQVFAVTHSAQIASIAHHHFLIEKQEKEGRTETNVRALAREDRVNEIARILGGLSVTEAQRKAALDMLSMN